jgi:hypothetical protein
MVERGMNGRIKRFSSQRFGAHVLSVASKGMIAARKTNKRREEKPRKTNCVPAKDVRYAIVSVFCFDIPKSPGINRKKRKKLITAK